MTTAELSAKTGVPAKTIRRLAPQLDAIPVKGRTGWVFPDPIQAAEELLVLLRKRQAKGRKSALRK